MSTNALKIFCILLAAILFVPSIASIVQADDSDEGSPDTGKGKGPKPGKGPQKDNIEPIVTIVEPTATYLEAGQLRIVVTVEDEDENAVAVILVDQQPTWNTGNTVIIDVSDWTYQSEHFITAAYTDSGGKTGGDLHFFVTI
jgi:hypothetical protein